MGWMHDTLDYVAKEPIHRRFHHDEATFSLMYAWDENFVLPLSHDEVVHGKRSLLSKLPGDEWQRLATLRALYGHMWAHPGKKLLFMGGELAQTEEWSESRSLDWALLDHAGHAGMKRLVSDLNRTYCGESALWEVDFRPEGFEWLVGDARADNVLAYLRRSADGTRLLACLVNFSPVVRDAWSVPLPRAGGWREVLNTDAGIYGGTNVGNLGEITAEANALHGREFSAAITLPPLAAVWLVPDAQPVDGER
jgi:1,4-alpha-glucan branching enzyme